MLITTVAMEKIKVESRRGDTLYRFHLPITVVHAAKNAEVNESTNPTFGEDFGVEDMSRLKIFIVTR